MDVRVAPLRARPARNPNQEASVQPQTHLQLASTRANVNFSLIFRLLSLCQALCYHSDWDEMEPRILMIRIPKSIHPCPIIDAISEIRFNPSTDPDAVYGVLFSAFRRNFSVTEKLPITQIPQEIRESDGSLFWQPHYRMKNDDFVIQIGPRVISVGV